MTAPPTADQTRNLAHRAQRGQLTPAEAAHLIAGVERLIAERDAAIQPPDGALCGLPHHRYPGSVCGEPAGHDRPPLPHRPTPHAAVLVIGGRECGSVAWDADTTTPRETAR